MSSARSQRARAAAAALRTPPSTRARSRTSPVTLYSEQRRAAGGQDAGTRTGVPARPGLRLGRVEGATRVRGSRRLRLCVKQIPTKDGAVNYEEWASLYDEMRDDGTITHVREWVGPEPAVKPVLLSRPNGLRKQKSGAGCALSLCVRASPISPGDVCSIYLY